MTQEQTRATETIKVLIENFNTIKPLGITSDELINLIQVVTKEHYIKDLQDVKFRTITNPVIKQSYQFLEDASNTV